MTWTCDQVETQLSDYLEGLLQTPERAEFEAHVAECAQCAPLVATVGKLLTGMHSMEQVEPPPRLIYSILDKTLGPRETVSGWQGLLEYLRGFASPKFAYGAASVMATFVILLGATGFSFNKPKLADLRPASIYNKADRQVHLGLCPQREVCQRLARGVRDSVTPAVRPERFASSAGRIAAQGGA